MRQYLDLMDDVLKNGVPKMDRTGVGTLSVFGRQLRFDVGKRFPLVTTKKLHIPSIIHELLWFIAGDTNTKYLNDNGVKIWNEWADPDGNLGPIYGKQWRKFGTKGAIGIDQLYRLVWELNINPDSRRMIVSAWNPLELHQMALLPCHVMFQCYVVNEKLSLHLYQRSSDVFLGLPFNIASYALLLCMLAHVTNLHRGELIISIGDAHLYSNHLDQAAMQLERIPIVDPIPQLGFCPDVDSIFNFRYEDIMVSDYIHHPAIKAPVAI